MNLEIKNFLNDIQSRDSKMYFLLYKFYLNPSNSLGGSDEKTIDNYYQYGDIKYFIMNNTFFEFLKICMWDEPFYKKLDLNLLRKIRFILFDSKGFKKEYFSDFEDPYFRDFYRKKVPIGPIYGKKYNNLQIWCLEDHFKQYGWIYELNLEKEKISGLNMELIEYLSDQNRLQMDIYYEKYVQPIEDRRVILSRISEDDYDDNFQCFLADRSGYDRKVFTHLICDNEFLEIAENILLNKKLSRIVIEHILQILTISVNFKTMNSVYDDFYLKYNLLKDKIKVYDYKKAKQLIPLFENKKRLETKVIKLECK